MTFVGKAKYTVPSGARFAFTGWLALSILFVILAVGQKVETERTRFNALADTLFREIERRVLANEAVVDGYAGILAAIGSERSPAVRSFVKTLLAQNPQINTIEAIRRIAHRDLAFLVDAMQAEGIVDFFMKRYSAKNPSGWISAEKQEYYFPVSFIAPSTNDAYARLGVDVSTVPNLSAGLQQAVGNHDIVTTFAFGMPDVGSVYALFKSATRLGGEFPGDRLIALITVKARALLPDLERAARYQLSIDFDVESGSDSERIAVTGEAHEPGVFLPTFLLSRPLSASRQPLRVAISKPVGWREVGVAQPLFAFGAATVLSGLLWILVHVMRVRQVERREYQTRLFRMANFDSVTNLANRNLFENRLEQAVISAQRHRTSLAVLFLDLDGFKTINDTHGHAAGDAVLAQVAERFVDALRGEDTVARLAGDEFVALLPGVSNRKDARTVGEKLIAVLTGPCEVEGKLVRIGVSIGVALYPEDDHLPEKLIKTADHHMYQAKRSGKNRVWPQE